MVGENKIFLLTSLMLVSLMVASVASAATISVSTTTPTVDGRDVANLNAAQKDLCYNGFTCEKLWTDTRAIGQTFTTGNQGGVLTEITLQLWGSGLQYKYYTLVVGKVSGNTYTQIISNESAVQTTDWATGDYVTFKLSRPVVLSANTVYGFDLAMDYSEDDWGTGIPYMYTTLDDLYPNGSQYRSTVNKQSTSPFGFIKYDKVFHVNIEQNCAPTETCGDKIDNNCNGEIDENCVDYQCFVPDELGDTTMEIIKVGPGSAKTELKVQEILNGQGYNINAYTDVTNIQVWNATLETTLKITYIKKQGGEDHDFGWYDTSTNTFNYIFNDKTASEGDTFTVTIPEGSTIGFAIQNLGNFGTGYRYTENSLNPNSKDLVLVYDFVDEFVLAFEDWVPKWQDDDFNDIVVSIKRISPCCTDEDGDGFKGTPIGCGPDCDDTDASVNPGATEVYCDGKDNDCNNLTVDNPDVDGDGVNYCEDYCKDTQIPEAVVPTERLGTNRFALTNNDWVFDTTNPSGKGPRKSFTTTDTMGCSCEQILAMSPDEMEGHWKYGCSISVMEEFVSGELSNGLTGMVTMSGGALGVSAIALVLSVLSIFKITRK